MRINPETEARRLDAYLDRASSLISRDETRRLDDYAIAVARAAYWSVVVVTIAVAIATCPTF